MDERQINGQLSLILERIDRNRADLQEIKKDMVRKGDLETLRGQYVMSDSDHEHRLRELEKQSTATEERWRLVNMLQVAWATIAAALAAWVGTQR